MSRRRWTWKQSMMKLTLMRMHWLPTTWQVNSETSTVSWMLRLCRENGRRVAAQSYSTKHCAFTTIVYLLVTHADGSRGVWFISDRLPLRHLGIYIKQSTNFKYSIDHAKRSFYRSANAIFGRVGRIASEDITLQLINTKCIPILLYVLKACPLLKSNLSAIDFVINRLFMKLFRNL